MKNVIHIYGASGSGTSTLGRKISEELEYKFMDTDDYFALSTNPPYTTKRSKEERLALMKKNTSLVGLCSTRNYSKLPSFRTIVDDVLLFSLT